MSAVYCHGLPGSPTEWRAFAPSRQLLSLDRLGQLDPTYESNVLEAFDALNLDAPTNIIGFSLGAMAAIHIAARRPLKAHRLILVSPAAPLELGNFLPSMAGKPVFEAAQRGALSLQLLTIAQNALLSVAPKAMLQTMFATSAVAERGLLADPSFQTMLVDGMKQCFGSHQRAYQNELIAFVRPWAHLLDNISCDVTIWQGEQDSWTPPAMSAALQSRLGSKASVHTLNGRGHYGALKDLLTSHYEI
ncbi:alpha/beta fold hydrolase [Candidatus Viadribacter manganicus]|uniref:AB hydrolase-1 domain-containing protein n=1 Tax=Candidatus Viadribacter manganicus TaxID=1759059 RepID=A0A1B1AL97_9PROT|nr:alpha/beta hydrolase [Candidatus Viadribacter manganicus]ANP47300.1 hypothetical protein ATE48_15940 [Candidatus Viadribacter manganicus]